MLAQPEVEKDVELDFPQRGFYSRIMVAIMRKAKGERSVSKQSARTYPNNASQDWLVDQRGGAALNACGKASPRFLLQACIPSRSLEARRLISIRSRAFFVPSRFSVFLYPALNTTQAPGRFSVNHSTRIYTLDILSRLSLSPSDT